MVVSVGYQTDNLGLSISQGMFYEFYRMHASFKRLHARVDGFEIAWQGFDRLLPQRPESFKCLCMLTC